MRKKIAALALLAFVASANAEIIAFGFTGHVTGVGPPIFGLNPAVGDPVTGSFGYDTDFPDQIPLISFIGAYTLLPPYRLIVNIGDDMAWSGPVASAVVFDDFGGNVEDSFEVASQPAVVNGIQTSDVVLSIRLLSSSTGVFPDDHLPSDLDLADFNLERIGTLNSSSVNLTYAQFSIESIVRLDALPPDPGPGIVPEPSGLQLLLIGLLAFAFAGRSRGVRALALSSRAGRRGRGSSRR